MAALTAEPEKASDSQPGSRDLPGDQAGDGEVEGSDKRAADEESCAQGAGGSRGSCSAPPALSAAPHTEPAVNTGAPESGEGVEQAHHVSSLSISEAAGGGELTPRNKFCEENTGEHKDLVLFLCVQQ